MLIFDRRQIGNNLLRLRKQAGLTQMELAEAAGLADRTYADIERGGVNMRVETLLRICAALRVTPNDVLVAEEAAEVPDQDALFERLRQCSARDRETALNLLAVYLRSVSDLG